MKTACVLLLVLVAVVQHGECSLSLREANVIVDCNKATTKFFGDILKLDDPAYQQLDRGTIEADCVKAEGPNNALVILGKCVDEEAKPAERGERLLRRLLDLLMRGVAEDQCKQAIPLLIHAFTGKVHDPNGDKWMGVCIKLGGIHGLFNKMGECVERKLEEATP